ncbi:mechanosensitive ion channel family protein [Algibacter amylolyticus]|uniref:Mechanosensitive ion channel family protein n=1 Tax=Algibacter amylolyticus TaxID=1608400 RepID=A0A5M7BFD8_9FLAO|nr:mechanosensitive ion channel family protein [Algibacter amylolyticus]KAA5826231.1 mechanosensitive ion channel family protein [Algibacter amylolyticus]MBB5268433.1 small-conductance mechanosensitive channel [Algibacter amylolyticus]TSJ80269.1 mechanosensitive ion channel family protein [Algibacter amylolyticus]
MTTIEYIKEWLSTNPLIWNVIRFLAILFVILLGVQLVRRYLKKHISNTVIRYKSQKAIEIIGYGLLIFLAITYFSGSIKDFTIIIGLFTAGLAFTLQELILSIAGSIYIFLVKVYKPGDRIEINGIKGDVIDVDSIYTTMMEIGQWVESDNYSGRIVKLSNAFVFKGPIYNYSQDFPFIWDQFNLPIRYGSDMELAKSIVIKIASETLSEYTKASKSQWEAVVNKYYIEDAIVEPTLAVRLTDNWVEFNLRYIVDYKKRRLTRHLLHDEIRKAFEQTNGKVVLASTTIELIKIPEIKINSEQI